MQTHDPETLERPPLGERTSPRRWIVMVLGAVVVGAVAFGLGAIVGSGGSDDLAEPVAAPEVVDEWGGAFVAGDPQALAALYGEGATFNCRAFDFTIGSEEIADVVLGDETDFTAFKPTTVLAGDEIIAVEYLVSAESPSGKSVSTPLIAVFDVDENGLIKRSTIDYDRREMFPDQFADASEQGLTALGCRVGS